MAVTVLALASYGSDADSDDVPDCASYRFPVTVWKAGNREFGRSPEAARTRRAAAQALVRCRLLRGASRDNVRELLGRPHRRFAKTEWDYLVGPTGGQDDAVDDDYLTVIFSDGRVQTVRIAQF